jgi:hypothetical protein
MFYKNVNKSKKQLDFVTILMYTIINIKIRRDYSWQVKH